MEFRYRYQTRVSDLWQLSMYYAWSSYLAVINLVCIGAAIALIVSCWQEAGFLFRCAMIVFLCMFPAIQPTVVWFKARRQLSRNVGEIELYFNRSGLTITAEGKQIFRNWGQIKRVVVKPTLAVVYVDDVHGYILSNRVLGDTREKFLSFVKKCRA